jgi:PPOX class probable F420-dependent enzyme
MSAAKIPASVHDLFSGKALANLATVNATGQPLVTPVWVDREGDRVLINSASTRLKNRNMRSGSRVALSILDPENPMRYVGVQGRVVEVREAGADEQLDRLAQRYIGQPKYPWRQPGEKRELFVIEPLRVRVQE